MITKTHNQIVYERVYKKCTNFNERGKHINFCGDASEIFERPFSYKGPMQTVNTHTFNTIQYVMYTVKGDL